jgi:tetratricopeptide (TPR) repeat protein
MGQNGRVSQGSEHSHPLIRLNRLIRLIRFIRPIRLTQPIRPIRLSPEIQKVRFSPAAVNHWLIFVLLLASFSGELPANAKSRPDAYKMATDAFQRGDYSKVFAYLQSDDQMPSLLLQGRTMQTADFEEAWIYFQRAHDRDPQNVEACVGYAWRAIRRRNYREACAEMKATLACNPGNAEVLSSLGRSEFLLGQTKEGLEAMTRALEKNSKSFVVYGNIVTTFCELVEFEKAEVALTKAIASCPHDPLPLLKMARLHSSIGKVDLAIADCTRALAINPHFQLALCERARLFFKKGENSKALADANAALEERNVRAFVDDALRIRIKIDHKLGHTEDAIADLNWYLSPPRLNQVQHMSNGTKESLFDRATDYETLKKYSEALRDVQLVSTGFPKSTDALVFAARLHREMGKYSQSLIELDRLIAIDKGVPEWHRQRAAVFQKLGRSKEADSDLAIAKELEARM